MSSESATQEKLALNVLYDLQYAPITFDFTTYLVLCESVRQLEGFKCINIKIKAGIFRNSSEKDHSVKKNEKEWRTKSIILDSCDLLPTISNVCISRISEQISGASYHLPPDYSAIVNGDARYTYALKDLLGLHRLGANIRSLISPEYAKHLTQKTLATDYITLTLRTSNHLVSRNVDLEEWYKFYHYLLEKGHKVYVIPDFEDVFANEYYKQYDWQVFPAASLDQRIRLAMYEGAQMNFSTSGGSTAMLLYSNAPYAIFDVANSASDIKKLTTEGLGLSIGGSCPWSLNSQRYFWEKSTFSYMLSAYEEMIH